MGRTFYKQKGNEKYTDSCGLETSMSGGYAVEQLVVALR